ncbi:hypothetical protein PSAC2689_120201 [Paraburkholderia sacchari]
MSAGGSLAAGPADSAAVQIATSSGAVVADLAVAVHRAGGSHGPEAIFQTPVYDPLAAQRGFSPALASCHREGGAGKPSGAHWPGQVRGRGGIAQHCAFQRVVCPRTCN